jgi:hypothetical protein
VSAAPATYQLPPVRDARIGHFGIGAVVKVYGVPGPCVILAMFDESESPVSGAAASVRTHCLMIEPDAPTVQAFSAGAIVGVYLDGNPTETSLALDVGPAVLLVHAIHCGAPLELFDTDEPVRH